MLVFAATLVASLSLATPGAVAVSCPGAELVPAASSIGAARDATLCLLNEQRAAAGLSGLTSESLLSGAATRYSQAMVDGHFFDHVSPSGEGLQQRLTGYLENAGAWTIGENIAWGEGSRATPAVIVDGWMHSEYHRSNILNPAFREIGVGIVNGSPRGSAPSSATYTTDFGGRGGAAGPPVGLASAPVDGASSPSGAQAAAATQAGSSGARKPAKLSAAAKRRIKRQCARVARRKHGSQRARRTALVRCVTARTRAASKRS